jgi:hypothetical protein
MRYSHFSLCVTLTCYVSGCVSLSTITANGAGALAPKAEVAMRRGQSYEAFKLGAPSGLQMLEASLLASPDNREILASLAKGYNAYATLAGETEILFSQGQRGGTSVQWVIDYHTLAVNRARRFLLASGIKWASDTGALKDSLQPYMDDQQLIDIAFIASHSLKSLMALQRGRPATLTYAPTADTLSQFACNGSRKPTYPVWACDAMKAIESAEKPSVAGGNLGESRKIFHEIYQRNPASLMPLALWAEHGLSKKFSPDDWSMIKEALTQFQAATHKRQSATVLDANLPTDDDQALLNAVAARRIEFMAKHESEFF